MFACCAPCGPSTRAAWKVSVRPWKAMEGHGIFSPARRAARARERRRRRTAPATGRRSIIRRCSEVTPRSLRGHSEITPRSLRDHSGSSQRRNGKSEMAINGNQWQERDGKEEGKALAAIEVRSQSMAINGNQWQSMAIIGNHWQSLAINGCHRGAIACSRYGSVQSMSINGNHWQS